MSDPTAFLREFALARAEKVVEVPGGVVVRSLAFPAAHDHNSALLWTSADPDAVLAGCEDALADCAHRRLEIYPAAGSDALTKLLEGAGYEAGAEVIMTMRSPAADPGDVVELAVGERAAVATAEWAHDQPGWDADVHRQLGERIRTALPAARCTFLAVRGPDGDVRSHADLYVRGKVAQIEEVMTAEPFRRRGYAGRVVLAAAARAAVPTVFLVADRDDGPVPLYRSLGFEVTGSRTVWTRTPADSSTHAHLDERQSR